MFSAPSQSLTMPSPGFGLGLRTPHYPDFLAQQQPLDWLEIITDNYLVEGGKPLVMLDTIRRNYPVAMHGVAMSLGAAGSVDLAYLRRVKALAERIQPMWVSDHLCWIGPGPEQLHDLYPLPYTDESARHLIEQISRAQDVLQRRLVVENVSSYIDYQHSLTSEWQFLCHVANSADCLLLTDINNIYVSSVNHGFDPMDYLRALPAHRIQQFHLAGHSNQGGHIIDTHDHPVAPAVWNLYAQACQLFGPVATMIERDDHIPPLQELLDELGVAKSIASLNISADGVSLRQQQHQAPAWTVSTPSDTTPAAMATGKPAPDLRETQHRMAGYVLDTSAEASMISLLGSHQNTDNSVRLSVYHNAYRARLAEVLADTFEKTVLYMGSDRFEQHARAYAVAHVPASRSLSRYGATLPAYFQGIYPDNPELHQLAQLEFDMRACFDGPDFRALTAANAAADQSQSWLTQWPTLLPNLVFRTATTNVVQIWKAIAEDAEVPAPERLATPTTLIVWRKGFQPHFKTIDSTQAHWLRCMAEGASIAKLCEELDGSALMPELPVFGDWLRQWWDDEILLASDTAPETAAADADGEAELLLSL